jgi:tetratricopeptide (TPR) repeat protein
LNWSFVDLPSSLAMRIAIEYLRCGRIRRIRASRLHSEYYQHHLAALEEQYDQRDGSLDALAQFDEDWGQIRQGQGWAVQNSGDDAGAKLCTLYAQSGKLLRDLHQPASEHLVWLGDALNAAQRLSDRLAEAGHLNDMGSAYLALGEPRLALPHFERALTVFSDLDVLGGYAAALGNLGLAYANVGEHRQAVPCYERALAMYRRAGDLRNEGSTLGNIGNSYLALGDPQGAIRCYEKWAVVARASGDDQGECYALGNLVLLCYKQNILV